MSKKYLKGFNNFGYLPVTINEAGAYSVDSEKYTAVPGGKSCAPTDNKTDFSINADDGVWDSGADWTDTTLVVTVVEAELKVLAELCGARFDTEMDEGTLDEAPEVALTFSALRRDCGYRLYRYFVARCTSYKVSHTTKGESNDAQTYELTFKCTPRKSDNLIRATKDIEAGEPLTWIKDFTETAGDTTITDDNTSGGNETP